MANIKLEPCPCGAPAYVMQSPLMVGREWSVNCHDGHDCRRNSGHHASDREARIAWNRAALAGEMEELLRDAHSLETDPVWWGEVRALLARLSPQETPND